MTAGQRAAVVVIAGFTAGFALRMSHLIITARRRAQQAAAAGGCGCGGGE